MIGRIKSNTASKSGHKPEPKSLRITVQDALDIETKGRWWVVGASWMGDQHRVPDSGAAEESLSAPDRARAESISDGTVALMGQWRRKVQNRTSKVGNEAKDEYRFEKKHLLYHNGE